MKLDQILDTIGLGLVVLDKDCIVRYWNRWLVERSGIDAATIVGRSLFEFFPAIDTPRFQRNAKSVLAFGNFSFFSHRLHGFLFPLKPSNTLGEQFEQMQQSCMMGPVRDDGGAITALYVSVEDVTEMVSYQRQLQRLNVTDALTGVSNRRHLEERLLEEFIRHRRYKRPLSLIMFDIDFFKKVNDTYGHQCGDKVLAAVAGTMRSSVRTTDFIARYGGEEFCCLVPETDYDNAKLLADRLRHAVSLNEIACGESCLRVTVSAGVSRLDESFANHEQMLASADKALYAAKDGGRNRVEGSFG